LTNVACVEAGLEFSYFQVGSHVVVTVSDPLSDAAYRACHNLFRVDVFYEHLELQIVSCLVKNLVYCCLELAAVFLLRMSRVQVCIPYLPNLECCLPD